MSVQTNDYLYAYIQANLRADGAADGWIRLPALRIGTVAGFTYIPENHSAMTMALTVVTDKYKQVIKREGRMGEFGTCPDSVFDKIKQEAVDSVTWAADNGKSIFYIGSRTAVPLQERDSLVSLHNSVKKRSGCRTCGKRKR